MPLEVNEHGMLTAAIHDTDLAEIGELFGKFQRSDRRIRLFRELTEYVNALRKAGIRGWLVVDGSFVMRCVDEPDDIDVVLVLAADWDLSADLASSQYNLVSKRAVKRRFPIEVYPVVAGSETERKWTEFFHQVNVKWIETLGLSIGSQMGLARILL
jgi:hypothetical protein